MELKYYLSGEHRNYDLSKGGFTTNTVNRNFHLFENGGLRGIDGLGAWKAVSSGVTSIWTIGETSRTSPVVNMT